MKKTLLILVIISLAAFFSMLTGCAEEEDTMEIDERIEKFVSDLNDSNRDGIFKEHFHPDASSYDGNEGTIVSPFPNVGDGIHSYSLTSLSGSGTTRSVVINNGVTSDNCTFTMKEDGEDYWCILSISGDVTL